MMNTNIDYEVANAASSLVSGTKQDGMKDLYRLATDALSVLYNHGVYGLSVFLTSRREKQKEIGRSIATKLVELARRYKITTTSTSNDARAAALEIVKSHDSQSMAFALFERALIYMRYLAKAEV